MQQGASRGRLHARLGARRSDRNRDRGLGHDRPDNHRGMGFCRGAGSRGWRDAGRNAGLTAMRTFNDRMSAGRDRAKAFRDRGGSSIRVVARTTSRQGNSDYSEWQRADDESSARWNSAVTQFLEDIRADLFGQQWKGFEL